MKKLMISMIVMVCLLGMVSGVYANSGKAYIPAFFQSSGAYSYFHISNITENDISVTVTLYNSDGTIIKDNSSASSGILRGSSELLNYSDSLTEDASASFTLEGHTSGYITIYPSSTNARGYGKIEWNQDDSSVVFGLIAYGHYLKINDEERSRAAIIINNGKPF